MKDVIIYGAGAMGMAVQQLLFNRGINVKYILDRNQAITGSIINGSEVVLPESLDKEYYHYDVIVSISACPYYIINDFLKGLGFLYIYSAVDYIDSVYADKDIVGVWTLNTLELETVNSFTFDDDLSAIHFNIAKDWFTNRSEGLYKEKQINITRDKYFPEFIKLNENDVYVDTGILNGEFLERFFQYSSAKKAYAFVLNPESVSMSYFMNKGYFEKTSFFYYELSDEAKIYDSTRIGIMNPYTSDRQVTIKTDTIDNIFQNIKISYLRIYSMSEAKKIIMGGIETIIKYRPIISVNISHYKTDFVSILPLLKNKLNSYSFYFRMHSFLGNDCILYVIPKERDIMGY